MTIARKGLILVSVPLILQFIFVLVLSLLLHYSQEDAARLSQSRTFVTKVDSINRDFLDLGLALAAFRYTKVHKFMTQYDHITAGLPEKFDELRKLSEGYPSRLSHVEMLQKYGNNVIEMTQSFRRPSDSAIVYLMDPIAYRQKVSDAFAQFSAESIAIDNEEIELQQGSPASEATMRKWLTVCIAFGLLSSTLLTVILTRFFMTNITRRLAVLTANSNLFSHKKPLIAPVKGDDEIADLDQTFRKMVDQIQEAENRKQLYVKMISHDLRGPITSMRGTFEAAAMGIYGQITDKGKVRFSAAVSDSERLIDLISEMIDYDGLADGSIELEREQFAAEELMSAAKDSLESLAEGKQVELQFSSDEALLTADKERLKRVLINLIHNAIKFSPTHSVVKAEAKREDDTVVFRIIDRGPGIKQSEIDQLFEPFQMGESAKSTVDKGSGLGLAICKMIVEAHDGNLGVESKSGKGSCFWFKLPLSHASVSGSS
jgi:signal transduction histidine kinase